MTVASLNLVKKITAVFEAGGYLFFVIMNINYKTYNCNN